MARRVALVVLIGVLVGCGTTTTPAPTANTVPTTDTVAQAPGTTPETQAPDATPAAPTPLSDEAAMLATIAAGTTPTATPSADQPTAIPTITLGPTAIAQPLAAGWWDGAVCYEVFVRSFADSDGNGVGDFNGLTEKLDYINDGDPATTTDLGANCIWLMPVAEAASYHGYDTVDYYAVEQDYGTKDEFLAMIDAAHVRGIKVIVDLVLNHTSSQHAWFLDAAQKPDSPYRNWYIWSKTDPGYRGPWGDIAWHRSPVTDEYYYGVFWEGMPDLNYRNPEVIAEAEKIGAFWLNDLKVDGFRFDAIKHIVENGRDQENTRETFAWLRSYAAFLRATKADVFSVGEIFGGRPGILDPYYPDQLDTYFEFGIGEGIIRAARGGDAREFMRAATAAYNRLPYQRYAPFLTNHDQERVMTTLDGDQGRMRIAATALLTLPGLPFIYYGEEIGMAGVKPDQRIRTPMQWSAEAGAGFTTGTAWEGFQSDLATVNVAAQDGDPDSLLNLYRALIHLHTETPALATGSFTALESQAGPAVTAYLRRAGDSVVLVVLNFGTAPIEGASFSVARSDLEAGTYQANALFGQVPASTITIGADGAVDALVPVPTLAPQSGYVLGLTR